MTRKITYLEWLKEFKPIMTQVGKPKEFTYNEALYYQQDNPHASRWYKTSINNENVISDSFHDDTRIIYVCEVDYDFTNAVIVHTGIITNDELLCCRECGSYDIMKLAWVNTNTNTYVEDSIRYNTTHHCNGCQGSIEPIMAKYFSK